VRRSRTVKCKLQKAVMQMFRSAGVLFLAGVAGVEGDPQMSPPRSLVQCLHKFQIFCSLSCVEGMAFWIQ
jgi:hypothetical protein